MTLQLAFRMILNMSLLKRKPDTYRGFEVVWYGIPTHNFKSFQSALLSVTGTTEADIRSYGAVPVCFVWTVKLWNGRIFFVTDEELWNATHRNQLVQEEERD
jgi:hypothetical protein